METAVLKEINGTCNCFSQDEILEDFEVLERCYRRGRVFHEVLR